MTDVSIADTTLREQAIKQLIEELRNTPDFAHLPFPKDWYKKYDIPVPKPASFKEYITENHWYKCHFDPHVAREVRTEPAPGGVRPVPEPEVLPVEVITKQIENQTDADSQQQKPVESACSTESSETEPQHS